MSREIKFRAWDEDEEYMYWSINSGENKLSDFHMEIYRFWEMVDRYGFIIEQFIVAEDNQDIFEGDIIRETSHGKELRIFIAEDIRTFTREYDKATHSAVWEVIGNIHENKELLNES